jgi:hypothetical protein
LFGSDNSLEQCRGMNLLVRGMKADDGHAHCLPSRGVPDAVRWKSAAVNVGADAHVPTYTVAKGVDYAVRMWLSVLLAAVLALGGAASAHGSEDAVDGGVISDNAAGGIDQADGALIAGQDGIAVEDAWFGGALR